MKAYEAPHLQVMTISICESIMASPFSDDKDISMDDLLDGGLF